MDLDGADGADLGADAAGDALLGVAVDGHPDLDEHLAVAVDLGFLEAAPNRFNGFADNLNLI